MLETSFKTIGIIVRQQSSGHKDEIRKIFQTLKTYGELLIHYLDEDISLQEHPSASIEQIGENADLVVSVGGDGTLLTTTRLLVDYQVPLVGINLGRLGFLADVTMLELKQHLDEIFEGNYSIEKRFLLQGEIDLHKGQTSSHIGLNDIILHSHESVSMIEFEVFSDGKLINRQRADGLIVSTPTGSTAYSLSGGGPIMHPSLQAISLVPICPHTLSNRPIVLPADRQIDIHLSHNMQALVSFDGVTRAIINDQDKIHIQRYHKEITLLHPAGYNYFHILRAKLNWSNHP
jgi:NAD+ kinase